jgi:hypothetical protein
MAHHMFYLLNKKYKLIQVYAKIWLNKYIFARIGL